MKWFVICLLFILVPQLSPAAQRRAAPAAVELKNVDGYTKVEGEVSTVTSQYLVINGTHYAISIFARCYDRKGTEITLQSVAEKGYLTRARIYALKGTVEKIQALTELH